MTQNKFFMTRYKCMNKIKLSTGSSFDEVREYLFYGLFAAQGQELT